MRLGDLDVLKEMLIKERDAIPLTKTERYGFGVELPNQHGMSMRGGINKAFRCMEKVQTVDAVPVVRCKDCKRFFEYRPDYKRNRVEGSDGDCLNRIINSDNRQFQSVKYNDFCSCGERKETDGNG